MKAKYKRITQVDVINRTSVFKANGCHSWLLKNGGNTNVTIGGSDVVVPGASISSPEENPELLDFSELDVQFDSVNAPTFKAPDTGTKPDSFSYVIGVDPVPEINNKIIIYRSYITDL